MSNIFIIGSKGIPSNYGGFETFVDKLTLYKNNQAIKYHVACLNVRNDEFYYNKARCFNVKVKDIGSAKAVLYDLQALSESKILVEFIPQASSFAGFGLILLSLLRYII